MASLRKDKNGNYLVTFRWEGKECKRGLATRAEDVASLWLARVNETLMRIKKGWLVIPEGVDPAQFIASGGELQVGQAGKPKETPRSAPTIGMIFERFKADIPAEAKEDTTLVTEAIHRRHLARILGESALIESVGLAEAQRYAAARRRETWRDKPVSAETAAKELRSFRRIWDWAFRVKLIAAPCPWQLRELQIGKSRGREPFRTFEEIEARLARGKLSPEEESRLWECLYLTGPQVEELVEVVKASASSPWIHPMVAMCAMTAARRSELCRSQVQDIDFENGAVHIREKKRDRSVSETQRRVDLHPKLKGILEAWLAAHPGGIQTFANADGSAVSKDQATWHLNRSLASHPRYSKVPGFHTLRHSFASILASKGVDQRVIDSFMGHQTEAMRSRYRHLFPRTRKSAIESLLGD